MKRSATALLALLATALIGTTSGQDYQPPRCLSFSDECRPYANGWYSQPSQACCNQVQMTINNDFPCFCTLYTENQWSYWFEINYMKTLGLPAVCGLYFNLRDCPSRWGSGSQQPWGYGAGGAPSPPGGFASSPSASPQAAPESAPAPAPVSEAPSSSSPPVEAPIGSEPSPSPASAPSPAPQ